ncbi:YciI family protein, partial [Cladorrhinum samala]
MERPQRHQKQRKNARFMILVLANAATEVGSTPAEMLEMKKFNDILRERGMLQVAEGLTPTKEGFRLSFGFDSELNQSVQSVESGPFKETISGYWIVKAESTEAVLEVASEIPFREGEVEVRRIAGNV